VISWVGEWCAEQGVTLVRWWLDSPVSNSGRLAALMREMASTKGWLWEVQTTPYVDKELSESKEIVVTGDKIILDKCEQWTNLGSSLIESAAAEGKLEKLWLVDLPQEKEHRILDELGSITMPE